MTTPFDYYSDILPEGPLRRYNFDLLKTGIHTSTEALGKALGKIFGKAW